MNKKIKNRKLEKYKNSGLAPLETVGHMPTWPLMGYTLVETLVAIAILSLSILATFTAVQSSLRNSSISKDRITAFYLAQEGMEFIKNTRDENALNSLSGVGINWLTNLVVTPVGGSGPCDFGKTCRIDSPAKTITACAGAFGSCVVIRRDSNTGLWGYNGAYTATVFRREIQFSNIFADREVLATIRISWTNREQNYSFQVTESLFNRQ